MTSPFSHWRSFQRRLLDLGEINSSKTEASARRTNGAAAERPHVASARHVLKFPPDKPEVTPLSVISIRFALLVASAFAVSLT